VCVWPGLDSPSHTGSQGLTNSGDHNAGQLDCTRVACLQTLPATRQGLCLLSQLCSYPASPSSCPAGTPVLPCACCCVHVCVPTPYQGPTPNKPPGKLGDKYPSFQPTHATDALAHIQAAAGLNHAALQAGLHDQKLLLKEEELIQALLQRYASGAAAIKANRWQGHETAYADSLRQLAERDKVRPRGSQKWTVLLEAEFLLWGHILWGQG
jgi:hypothetical protein